MASIHAAAEADKVSLMARYGDTCHTDRISCEPASDREKQVVKRVEVADQDISRKIWKS